MTEPPHLSLQDDTPLQMGMIVSLEPGVATAYGTFHVEENVVVREDGCGAALRRAASPRAHTVDNISPQISPLYVRYDVLHSRLCNAIHSGKARCMRRLSAITSAVFALLIVCSQPLSAQVDTGTITGIVSDSSGAVLPAATVVLKNEGTGEVRNGATNEHGEFVFTPVQVGKYELSVSASGFQTKVPSGLELQVQQRLNVLIPLTVGTSTEKVVVTGAETRSADGGFLCWPGHRHATGFSVATERPKCLPAHHPYPRCRHRSLRPGCDQRADLAKPVLCTRWRRQ